MKNIFLCVIFFGLLASCSSAKKSQIIQIKESNERKDRIYRLSQESLYPQTELVRQEPCTYPWDETPPDAEKAGKKK